MTTQALNTIRAFCCMFEDFAAAPFEFSRKVSNIRSMRSGGLARRDSAGSLPDNPVPYRGNLGAGREVRAGRVPSPKAGVNPASVSGGRV
jgi:hypothetical protein